MLICLIELGRWLILMFFSPEFIPENLHNSLAAFQLSRLSDERQQIGSNNLHFYFSILSEKE